jgi:hypothetical protein
VDTGFRKRSCSNQKEVEWDGWFEEKSIPYSGVPNDVAQTLDKFAVPAAERAEVVAIVESTRRSIVAGQ